MRQMKDSGIEWVGQIPQVWDVVPIRAVFCENLRINYDGHIQNALQFKFGKIVPKTNFDPTEEYVANAILKYSVVQKDMFVINGLNLNFDFVTKRVGIVETEGVITSAYMSFAITDIKRVSPRYSWYVFRNYDDRGAFHNMGGGVRKILTFNELKHNHFIVPPLAEQERIAEFLDEKCAEVDALAGEIKEQIATLEEYKRSVITEAVTKGLDASVPMKDSGIEWIGEIPQAWDANRLRNLIVRREGGVWGLEPDDYEHGTICLRVADFNFGKGRFVEDNIDAFTKRKYSYAQILKYKLKKGDILIEKSGGGEKTPVGRAVLFDKAFTALFANFMDRLRFNSEIVNPYFIEYWLRAWYYCGASPYYINQTIGIQNINLSLMLAKQIIFYPPLAEQEKIAEFLDAKCAKVDALIAEKQNQLATLEEYKKSVIFEYVTGKKEVV